jgi:diacylglycerol kinase family enzyme
VRGLVIVNPNSGSGSPTADELVSAARSRGLTVRVLRDGDDAAEIARTADADALGVAGGDGSLAPVAAVAIERDLPFVAVPFGTRNHFARDAGYDRDNPIGALDAFADGREIRVDVGRVNGRPFLNNAALGVYARLVHHRERHRRRREALARARALLLALSHRHETAFTIDGEPVVTRALLVANNDYELDLFNIGEREDLDEGQLHLYVAHGLMPGTWEERAATRFVVNAPRSRARLALDGEPAALEAPLTFEVEPRALRLLLPPAGN